MSEPRVIKKYPNRRLYDTVESRYITLADIRRLVVERIDFLVVDKKSQEDITRAILLHAAGSLGPLGPLMSRDFLSQLIRSYGGAVQGVVGSYLEQSMKLLSAHHHEIKDQLKAAPGGTETMGSAASLAERNYQRWRNVQNDIFSLLSSAAASGVAREEPTEARGDAPVPRPAG